jgi:hypothetical protein
MGRTTRLARHRVIGSHRRREAAAPSDPRGPGCASSTRTAWPPDRRRHPHRARCRTTNNAVRDFRDRSGPFVACARSHVTATTGTDALRRGNEAAIPARRQSKKSRMTRPNLWEVQTNSALGREALMRTARAVVTKPLTTSATHAGDTFFLCAILNCALPFAPARMKRYSRPQRVLPCWQGSSQDSIYRGMMTATNNAYIKASRVLV